MYCECVCTYINLRSTYRANGGGMNDMHNGLPLCLCMYRLWGFGVRMHTLLQFGWMYIHVHTYVCKAHHLCDSRPALAVYIVTCFNSYSDVLLSISISMVQQTICLLLWVLCECLQCTVSLSLPTPASLSPVVYPVCLYILLLPGHPYKVKGTVIGIHGEYY